MTALRPDCTETTSRPCFLNENDLTASRHLQTKIIIRTLDGLSTIRMRDQTLRLVELAHDPTPPLRCRGRMQTRHPFNT